MKYSKLCIANFLLVSLLISSCSEENLFNDITGRGNISSKSLRLDSFTEIELLNYCNVEVVIGAENKVEFSDYDNIIQLLQFEVVNNRLIIKTVPENIVVYNSRAKAKVYLTGNLQEVFSKGSGNIDLLSPFVGLNQLNISGSGHINAKSSLLSSNVVCTISGSGNMDVLKINSTTAQCTISGSGNISIAVSTSLNGIITGSGNIYYQGNPIVVKNISGSGNVIQL